MLRCDNIGRKVIIISNKLIYNELQISDDEDDTHPNVDTPSLFRWRHDARVERMKEMEEEKAKFQKMKDEYVYLKFF